jgi:ATP-binding cassette subfamily B protein RaxB
MVACYYGVVIDLPAMRRRFSTSSRGYSLSRVISIAHSLGLNTRPIRLELEHISQIQTPCILHWNMSHFVVLKNVSGNRLVIHDPAVGKRSISVTAAGKCFTGIALELTPSSDFKPMREVSRISIRKLVGSVQGINRVIIQVILLALVLEFFAFLTPLYLQTVVDEVLVTADLQFMTVLAISFLLVVSFRACLSLARGWAATWIGGKFNAQWVANS